MKIPCSNCNQRLEIPEELAGQTIECPACKASLTVPSLQPPPVTPQVQVTTPQAAAPQAAAPQKTAPQRKTSTALKAASSKKSKLPIPKWAIAAVGGVTVMALVMYFLSGPSVDIWEAAETGNIEAVKKHLADGVDVNVKDDEDGTPLHYAAVSGRKEVAELLIANGADVKAKNKYGWTPLYFAKTKETADLLRKHGGKGNAPVAEAAQPEPQTVKAPDISILDAARNENIEAVKQHLAAGTDVNAKDDSGWTPLHWAANDGYKEIAELLITKGADVDGKTTSETTPLHNAAYNGHKEIVELLIAKGANVNAKNEFGQPPLTWAFGQAEIADLLRKHGGKTGAELKAADKPTAPVAEAAQPEPTTAKAHDISIHKAATLGNIEAVKQHLAAGADVNAKDKYGRTPLHTAVDGDYKELIELLIAEGADVNANSKIGTPLHSAATWGQKEIVELLIAKGAGVNAIGSLGRTPLDWAITSILFPKGHPKTADLLRKHGGKTGEELKAEGK